MIIIIIIIPLGIMVRVFANGLGDLGSIPGQVIPEIQKMVLDDTLLNVMFWPFDQAKNAIQGDAPEGSDIF